MKSRESTKPTLQVADFVRGVDAAFKGNKQSLPSKPCVACGRPMSWRKRWARTWGEVKFCSDACRNARGAGRGT
ncbi:MAG TPA: DUF2256 domain-containing protein [Burkholderiaceae bacterium]|nr:DUF2256 domain-containing protein [Burkholderiaceae bacterium]